MAMIKVLLLLMLFLTLTNVSYANNSSYQLYQTDGKRLTVGEVAQQAARYDVVVFGEYHDNAVLHQLEYELLQNLVAAKPQVAVSLEMFERDTQPLVDAYLAKTISEAEFLAGARPWPNYQSDYRPLVELAKQQSLPVLAANIPRPIAADYAKTGSLAELTAEQQSYLPRIHRPDPGRYQQKFFGYMSGQDGRMRLSPDKIMNYYQAQCLKDDAMAESIADHLTSKPQQLVIHYQGDFHSRERLGVVEKLQLLQPNLKILVIAPVYVSDFNQPMSNLTEHRSAGDVIVLVKQ